MSAVMDKKFEKIFEKEFLPHADALRTFAYHLTYDDVEADDLVQDTFMKAFRFIENYETGTNAKAWLFKILKNGFINEFRRKSKIPQQVDYDEVAKYHDDDESANSGYTDLRVEMFHHLMGDEVTNAINDLPVEFRTVILLCDVEEFSYEEISKILDIPLGTVRSRLHRARNLLKEKLKNYAESLGYEDKR